MRSDVGTSKTWGRVEVGKERLLFQGTVLRGKDTNRMNTEGSLGSKVSFILLNGKYIY